MRLFFTLFAVFFCCVIPTLLRAQPGSADTTKPDWYLQTPALDFSQVPASRGSLTEDVQNATGDKFYALYDGVMYILNDGFVLRSSDAGVTWAKYDLPGCFRANNAQFLNDTDGWLVGDYGAVYKTTDGGKSWLFVWTPFSAVDFIYVSFVSPQVGYISGSYGVVLKTTDGGETWIAQDYWNLENPGCFAYVKAIDDSNVWILDEHAEVNTGGDPFIVELVVHTTNGGDTWDYHGRIWESFMTLNTLFDSTFNSINCCSKNGMTFYFSYLVKVDTSPYFISVLWRFETHDGGATWDSTQRYNKVTDFPDMFTCTAGWGLDGGGNLFRATNPDSLAWIQRTTPCNDSGCRNLYYDFIDTLTGWCVTDEADTVISIYETTDGALTWQLKSSHSIRSGRLEDVSFINPDTGWAVGVNPDNSAIVLHTTNSGANWQSIYNPARSSLMRGLRQVQFVNADTGWALGDSIYRTKDGGATWQADNAFPLDSLRQGVRYVRVEFVDDSVGWVARSDWLTYRTSDGGVTWEELHSPDTTVTIAEARPQGENAMLAVGLLSGEPYVFRTTTGQGWQDYQFYLIDTALVNPPGSPRLLYFRDSLTGWMIDSVVDIYKTLDGGLSWKYLANLASSNPPLAAWFVDSTDGWLLKGNDTLFEVSHQLPVILTRAGIIYFSGVGTLMPTGNNGFSAEVESCIKTQMNGITFVGDTLGWAVGDNMTIYHYYLPEAMRPHFAPRMALSAPGIDFGTTAPGVPVQDSVIVYNTGNAPLYIWGAAVQSKYGNFFNIATVIRPDSQTYVMPGDSLVFYMDFSPKAALGLCTGALYIYSNADTQQVMLDGTASFTGVGDWLVAGSGDLSSYPNPFTGATTVLYAAGSANAKLGVYDVLGKEVLDLTSRLRPEGGAIEVNAGGLPAGVYYCVLTRGARRDVQEMLKVR